MLLQRKRICMDSLTLSALGTITSITVKNRLGVNVTTTVSGITNKATLRNAIITAIQAAGGYLNGGGLKVNNPTGTVYNITGMGEVQLVSLENGATRTFTHACTSAYECAVTFFLPYSVGQVALIILLKSCTDCKWYICSKYRKYFGYIDK